MGRPHITAALEAGGLLPDVVEEPPRHLNVQRAQKREQLRFTSTHWNGGDGPLQIRGGDEVHPCVVEEAGHLIETGCTYGTQEILDGAGNVVASAPAGLAVFHADHNHWHQDNVADFVLRSGALDGRRRARSPLPLSGRASRSTGPTDATATR